MTNKQKLKLKLKEQKDKLTELSDPNLTLTEEQRAELNTVMGAMRDTDAQLTALELAEPDPPDVRHDTMSAEDKEKLELRSKFSVGRYIGWQAGKAQLTGAETEYMAAMGTDTQLPISVFEPTEQRTHNQGKEVRAVTPGQQGGVNQAAIVPAVFKRSVAEYLGISMPDAGIGDMTFPVLSTTPASGVGAVAKDAAVNAAAGAFTVSTQQPRRIGAAFEVRVEDLARLAGMEQALRTAIQGVIAEKLDDEILNGAASAYNTDGQIRGLLVQLTDPSAPAAGVETWARWHTAAVSHLADPWATSLRDIRLLVGTVSYQQAAGLFRATESNESFPAYWDRVGGGMRLSGKIASPASHIQQAVVVRMNPANDAPAVMPAWSGFDMTIRDMYSNADKGQVKIVVHMLVGDVVLLRSDVYVQDSFRVTS
ncbi:MAG: hypothetical protein F4X63_08190 [Nitrospira sp. SB0662_bin_26]|nr:hypothetical protein [Nitrospira sp. SB0662_bin_26]